jgi:hypothetical protein
MEALEREATAFEEEAGVDTRGLVFERPDGVAGRWEKPGAWVRRKLQTSARSKN